MEIIKIRIRMENNKEMQAELYPEIAPITVENFVNLINKNFFDGIIFHRVIKDFMIQGGDPTGTGRGGSEKTIKGDFIRQFVQSILSDFLINNITVVLNAKKNNIPLPCLFNIDLIEAIPSFVSDTLLLNSMFSFSLPTFIYVSFFTLTFFMSMYIFQESHRYGLLFWSFQTHSPIHSFINI